MTTQNPNLLLQQALQENWNHATDWLWLAKQVQLIEHRVFCLKKALHIAPNSRDLQGRLRRLESLMSQEQALSVHHLQSRLAEQAF